jgi:hypothetical protein
MNYSGFGGGHGHGHHHHHGGFGGFNGGGFGGQGIYPSHIGGFMSVSVTPSFGFNRWGNAGYNYQSMGGYNYVDYSNGWSTDYHDQLLRSNIDQVYARYDVNFSGQLEGNEFYFAYRDLCLRMGLAPPMDYMSVWNAAMACDSNRDGRISKIEMFMLFKRIQGINYGQMY